VGADLARKCANLRGAIDSVIEMAGTSNPPNARLAAVEALTASVLACLRGGDAMGARAAANALVAFVDGLAGRAR